MLTAFSSMDEVCGFASYSYNRRPMKGEEAFFHEKWHVAEPFLTSSEEKGADKELSDKKWSKCNKYKQKVSLLLLHQYPSPHLMQHHSENGVSDLKHL